MDFDRGRSDSAESGQGRRLRQRCDCKWTKAADFQLVDSYTRECLALEVDTSLPSRDAIQHRGVPIAIRSDNVPELTSRHVLSWCKERKIEVIHIRPGRPMQSGHMESFNGP